jgi:PadR family transcriptional regulator PadR
VDIPHDLWHTYVRVPQEGPLVAQAKLDLLQGTLDLMVLRTLSALGPLHGYGIARRIEQVSGDQVLLNQGTIYASLVRLQQRGWIGAEWGVSRNNRRAKYYSLTKAGGKQLVAGTENWDRITAMMGRVLTMRGGEQ